MPHIRNNQHCQPDDTEIIRKQGEWGEDDLRLKLEARRPWHAQPGHEFDGGCDLSLDPVLHSTPRGTVPSALFLWSALSP